MYIKVTNGTPTAYTIGQFRKDNPNTSFPKSISEEILASYGVYSATTADMPPYTTRTQAIEQNDTPTQVDGAWVYGWTISNKTDEQIAEYDALLAADVRAERDKLIASCDWMAIKAFEAGTTVGTAWATYRQALRDVTDQAGFPNEITWPTQPE